MTHANSAKEKRTGSLGCDALEDIVDERVQDGHGLVGDTSVRVHLLEYCASQGESASCAKKTQGRQKLTLVDVRRVSLLARLLALLLLAVSSWCSLLGRRLLGCLGLGVARRLCRRLAGSGCGLLGRGRGSGGLGLGHCERVGLVGWRERRCGRRGEAEVDERKTPRRPGLLNRNSDPDQGAELARSGTAECRAPVCIRRHWVTQRLYQRAWEATRTLAY